MTDDLEREYAVSPLPTADEVLAGVTQGGVAPPSGFFTDADLTDGHPAEQTVDAALAALVDAAQALAAAHGAYRAALLRARS